MLSHPTVESLRQIINEDYGKTISFKEAAEIAEGLVKYWDTLGEIFYEDQLNENEYKHGTKH